MRRIDTGQPPPQVVRDLSRPRPITHRDRPPCLSLPVKNSVQQCATTQKDRLIQTVFLFFREMGRDAYSAFP